VTPWDIYQEVPFSDGRQLELPGDDKQNSRSNDN
jgi:hypothetical protein